MYDGMTFPESLPPSLLKRVGTFFGFYKESDLNEPVPSHEISQERSFLIFLCDHKKALSNAEFSYFNFSKIVEDIWHMYMQLRVQKTCQGYFQSNYDNFRKAFSVSWVCLKL